MVRFFDIKNSRPLALRSFLRKKKKIVALCRRHGIALLFLHGSLARDHHGPLSDIDLAVAGPHLEGKKLVEFEDELIGLVGREDTDIAVLNHASPLLAMQVLIQGVPLYVKNQKILKGFRFRTLRDYLDHRYFYSRFQEYVTRAVL